MILLFATIRFCYLMLGVINIWITLSIKNHFQSLSQTISVVPYQLKIIEQIHSAPHETSLSSSGTVSSVFLALPLERSDSDSSSF